MTLNELKEKARHEAQSATIKVLQDAILGSRGAVLEAEQRLHQALCEERWVRQDLVEKSRELGSRLLHFAEKVEGGGDTISGLGEVQMAGPEIDRHCAILCIRMEQVKIAREALAKSYLRHYLTQKETREAVIGNIFEEIFIALKTPEGSRQAVKAAQDELGLLYQEWVTQESGWQSRIEPFRQRLTTVLKGVKATDQLTLLRNAMGSLRDLQDIAEGSI